LNRIAQHIIAPEDAGTNKRAMRPKNLKDFPQTEILRFTQDDMIEGFFISPLSGTESDHRTPGCAAPYIL